MFGIIPLKTFSAFHVRHCDYSQLSEIVNEKKLNTGRDVPSITFLQKLIRSYTSSEVLLNQIMFFMPRPNSKNVVTFNYYYLACVYILIQPYCHAFAWMKA